MAAGDTTVDTGGEFASGSRGHWQSGEARATRLGDRDATLPIRDPDQVHGRGRDHVLQMGFGQPDIATSS